jgi:hypothetical protein
MLIVCIEEMADLASSCPVFAVHRADFNSGDLRIQTGQLGCRAEDPKPALSPKRNNPSVDTCRGIVFSTGCPMHSHMAQAKLGKF